MYGKIRFHARIVSKLVSVHHYLKYKMMTIFLITAELQDIQVDRPRSYISIKAKKKQTYKAQRFAHTFRPMDPLSKYIL